MLIIQRVNKLTKGFSLIELLVVISIIGLLTTVLMANFMGTRERARDAKKIEELNAIKNALRMYYNDKQTYPPSGPVSTQGITTFSGTDKDLIEKYMPTVNSIGFTYFQTNNGDGFNLCTVLDAGAGDDDTNSQARCGMTASTPVCGSVIVSTDKLYVVCAN